MACANVRVSLFLSAPMALGTAHIRSLDTQQFSDYSPPIRRSGSMNGAVSIRLPAALDRARYECETSGKQGFERVHEFSDESLLTGVRNGSKDALGVLFRRYALTVRGIAYRVLRDTSEADDLVQDIFLLVHRLCGTFDSLKGSARFWILQMTYRRAISRRRYLTSRHFYTRVDLDDVEIELADPRTPVAEIEDSIDAHLGNGSLQKVFEELSENQRQTLQLFFVEGYTFDEIAEKLGQSRGNIKNHYFRGLERLRKHLFSGKLAGPRAV
jgi:RNA polymerase sigma-70 factor, ECF subfamily